MSFWARINLVSFFLRDKRQLFKLLVVVNCFASYLLRTSITLSSANSLSVVLENMFIVPAFFR